MFAEIVLLSLCGSLLCLDRIFIQAMISRPIVIAPLIGLIMNDPYSGLVIGALVELFWIDRLPVGTYIPPNDSVVAALATSLAVLAGRQLGVHSSELIALAVMCAIPFGVVAQKLDVLVIKSNDAVSERALEDAQKADIGAIEKEIYYCLMKSFLLIFFFLLALQLALVYAVVWLYPQLPPAAMNMLSLVFYFLPLLGIAVALQTLKMRGAVSLFCVLFLIVAVALELFYAR